MIIPKVKMFIETLLSDIVAHLEKIVHHFECLLFAKRGKENVFAIKTHNA